MNGEEEAKYTQQNEEPANGETASFTINAKHTPEAGQTLLSNASPENGSIHSNESLSTKHMNHTEMIRVLEEYAFNALCDECINKQKHKIKEYFTVNHLDGESFNTMKARAFKNDVVNHCEGNIEMKESLNKLYETIEQYPEYERLQSKLQANTEKTHSSCSCCACCNDTHNVVTFTINHRDISPNKLTLKCVVHDQDHQMKPHANDTNEAVIAAHLELTTTQTKDPSLDSPPESSNCKIEIFSNPYNIQCDDTIIRRLSKGDTLSQIGFGAKEYTLEGLEANEVYKIIRYQPVPFALTFKRKEAKCMKCTACCLKKENKSNSKQTESGKCTQRMLKWMIRFIKQLLPIMSKTSSIVDTVTDLVLLYKASSNQAVILTIVLFITLLPPYILSYSSGVQIFLYRKTFQNVQLFTFKSLLLGLYLFPTGIIYFILLDLMDVIAEAYKWIAYGIINKIKNEQELIQIESNLAEYFGMSRMDWISFKKQKLIAQLFFETVPQVILQLFLFLYSSELRDLSGITDRDLKISIASAVFNCIVQISRLKYESSAVQETFVQYALNCMSARYEWVPFKHQLDRFVNTKEDLLQIKYKIQYRLPLITALTENIKKKNEMEPLKIKYKHKKSILLFGSVQYDFSKITIHALISSIKNLSDRYASNKKRISIAFGESLRLLDVRSIISLMQCCKEKHIELPDITQIDWYQSFQNAPNEEDIRLFSNTFDTENKSLLISLYLTGYDTHNNYSILKQFVRVHDVPINIADYNGDTILHHMIRRKDYDGIYSVLFNLKPKQRFNFMSVNDSGDTIIHEMIKQNDYTELKHLLDVISLQSNGSIHNLGIFNNDGKTVIYLALEQDIKALKKYNELELDSRDTQCEIDWLSTVLTLENAMNTKEVNAFEKWCAAEEYDSDAIADDVEDEQGSNLFVQLSKDSQRFNYIRYNMRMITDLDLLMNDKTDYYDQLRKNRIDHETLRNIMRLKLKFMQTQNEIQSKEQYEQMEQRINVKHIRDSEDIAPLESESIRRDSAAINLRIPSINNEMYDQHVIKSQDSLIAKQKAIRLSKYKGVKLMHQLLIEKNPKMISSQIHGQNAQSVLGFMLNIKHLDNMESFWSLIINDLLDQDAQLLSKETNLLYRMFIYIIRKKSDPIRYLETLHKIMKKCDLLKICDKNGGNNPIHYLITSAVAFTPAILAYLCQICPEWMMMQNNDGYMPLYLAIAETNINAFFILCRFMVENQVNVKQILQKRMFVEKMIEFGDKLLRDDCESSTIIIQLLLSTFHYSEIFRWKEQPHNTFNPDVKSRDISLIKYASFTEHKHTIDKILYNKCSLHKDIYDKELHVVSEESKDETSDLQIIDDIELDINIEHKKQDKQNTETDEQKEEEDTKEDEEDQKEEVDDDGDIEDDELQSVVWIELAYSTLVETFSVADLITDIIILKQLYDSKHQWWTSWMLLLLISPYLVSHGSLVVTLKKKINFDSCWVGFLASLLMTPIALLYLFVIDIVFMIFALISILWLLFVVIFVCMRYCKYDAAKVSEWDIRDRIDETIFKEWWNMNRTEIVGYRRLRTLSQLFFETMPQIVLQLRIVWVINSGGDNNNNTFSIDMTALAWSIGLAIAHLILECIFIYLDKCAFKMSFMEYALECLGGRVQWVPFQHLLEDVIENQFYICNTTCDETNFNPESYQIQLSDNHHSTSLNYEEISADMKCFRYSVSYQFSSQSMNKLIEMIVNCRPMTVPESFKLLSTNVPIQNVMKSLLCTAQIKIGHSSVGSIDIASVCKLYRTCSQKQIDLEASCREMNVIQRLLKTQKKNQRIRELVLEMVKNEDEEQLNVDKARKNDIEIANAIKQTLKVCSESTVLEWVTMKISAKHLSDVKSFILSNALSNGEIKLDILRRCYRNQFYVALDCKGIATITAIMDECYKKCEHDESWYLVIIFTVLYSCGRLFGIRCMNGCCSLNRAIQNMLLLQWIPSYIEIGELKMSYILFENCGIYKRYIEEVFGNQCKNYIMSRDKQQNKQPVAITDDTTNNIMRNCKQWTQLRGHTDEYINTTMKTLIQQLQREEFDDENIALLDELIMELKMSSSHNKYLSQTMAYREKLTNTLDIKIEAKNAITTITAKQLIVRDLDQAERFQICQISFINNTENDANFDISFEDSASNINNKTFLCHMKEREDEEAKRNFAIAFVETNNGLIRYNYLLLHSDGDAFPSIMVQSSDVCDITIELLYTAMYSSASHKRLEEIRAKAVYEAEKALEEIKKLNIERYRFGRTLGSGASCRVVEATHKLNADEKVAIKIMDKDRPIVKKLFYREVNVLHILTPNVNSPPKGILPFKGYAEDEDSYYMITGLLTGGELFDRIVSKIEQYKITEKIATTLVQTMLETVKYCHDNGIVHRDLKPENFVFADKEVHSDLILIDFGCARIVNDDDVVEDVVGTAYYLAPELATSALHNYRKKGANINNKVPEPKPRTGKILKASDIWSIGVIAYVMMTGRAPFRGKDNVGIFESTVLKPLVFPEKDARYHNALQLSEAFKDFVRQTLVKDPLKRVSIEDALRHPWVQGLDASDYGLNRDVITYLQQFKQQTKLKKEVARVLASNMTSEPEKQVKKHFMRLDADGDGFLDAEELTFLLLDMGYVGHQAKAEAEKMIRYADVNQDGVLDFEEFKQIWYRRVLTTNDQYIHRVFDVFDDNGDGHIDAKELALIIAPASIEDDESIGDNLEVMETMQKLIEEVDSNGDKLIDFEEFKLAMKEELDSGKLISSQQEDAQWGGLVGPKIE